MDLKLDHVSVLLIYFKVQHGIPSIFPSVHEKKPKTQQTVLNSKTSQMNMQKLTLSLYALLSQINTSEDKD